MKYTLRLTRRHYTFAALAACLTILSALSLWNGSAFRGLRPAAADSPQRSDAADKKFYAQIRDGLGKGVQMPRPGDARSARAAVESLDNFINERAGVRMDNDAKQRLAAMEERTRSGASRRITTDELADVLTEAAMNRISALDDREIDHAAEVFSNGKAGLTLRANGRGFLRRPDFVNQARAMREQGRRNDGLLRASLRGAIGAEVEDRADIYSRALPDKFGGVRERGVTPLQAVVITYSVAADDLMHFSRESLRGHMEREHQAAKAAGENEPKPKKAYGPGGYYYSTPLDLALDKRTMGDLLDRIERRAQQ